MISNFAWGWLGLKKSYLHLTLKTQWGLGRVGHSPLRAEPEQRPGEVDVNGRWAYFREEIVFE